MFKKFFIFLLVVSCSAVIFAQDDYPAQWKAAYDLFRTGKYADAMDAFAKLAESTSVAGNKYNCYLHAGYSARVLKKYDESIAFADKIAEIPNPYKYYSQIRKMDFMGSGGKNKEILDAFKLDDILKWPKCYRSEGLYYLGLAQYRLKNGKELEETAKQISENAESGHWKGVGLLWSGHNYRNNLKDADKAKAAYSSVTDADTTPNNKSEAYDALAGMFVAEKKYDDALAEYDKLAAMEKVSDYWKARGLYNKANLLKNIGKKEEAIKCYKQSLAEKGCVGWIKAGCETQLKALKPKAE